MSLKVRSKEEVVEEFRIRSIQEAAMKVIARKGVPGASMQEIASEAGIAKGTLYLYFENQQVLLESSVDFALSQLLEELTSALELKGSFQERLTAVIATRFRFFEARKDFFQVYQATQNAEGGGQRSRCSRSERPQYQIFQEKFSTFLREAMRRGELAKADVGRLALFLEEGVNAVLVHRMKEKSPPKLEKDVEWLVATILEGIIKKRSHS